LTAPRIDDDHDGDEPSEQGDRASGIRTRADIEAPATWSGAERCGPAAAPAAAPRVLIVDDDAACSVLERALAECDVVLDTSGRAAVDRIARGERFDIVFCKVAMPGMTGWELYDKIDELAPEQTARIVFVVRRATERGTDWFLSGLTEGVTRVPADPAALRAFVATRLLVG
jgi:CheY-like chemotaxis protein